MAKIVHTQYRENYGAHQWDGKGECPQYWKNKGGDTYVIHGATEYQIGQIINYSSEYSSEYIINTEEYDRYNRKDVWQDWESQKYITRAEDGSLLVEYHSGCEVRTGLKSWKHTWEYPTPEARISGDCSSFAVEYVFEDGYVANNEDEARAHFETLKQPA